MKARKRSRSSNLEARKRSRPSILRNLPDDVIIEILSYLPVKCILRFKCVCKSWLMITQQKYFIEKHKSRSQIVYVYEMDYNYKYLWLDVCNGLVLEFNYETDVRRIRNPATKQVFQVTSEVSENNDRYILGFDPSTSMYKLFNFYIKKGTDDIGVCMLTIGSDEIGSWRYLNDITILNGKWREPLYIYHKDVSYTATYNFFELEKTDILRFTMDGKSSMNIKVPQSFQLVPGFESNVRLQMFIWGDDKLSLGFIIGHLLHVWVLENYEKHVWSEKKIIYLDFVKDYPDKENYYEGRFTFQLSPNFGQLRFTIHNHYLEYDVHSKSCISLAMVPPGKRFDYNITPSLVSLKGMCSEDP